ncbi:MFS transporter [Streptomyces sp. YC504]|uniref:Putative proline/betaine transporter n=1 Tax=Streptomyces mesophilus TaxID=1775132 RepID=A0A6G4XNM2_9ACTN|nr:MFS transporter [Streptomyces mesophilus]NGO78823.1 MFS transporter [Streptomyces mesophilus]
MSPTTLDRQPSETPQPPVGDVTVTDPALVKRAVKAAALGNAMEWFDFGVYGYLAVTIGHVFFPEASSTAQVLSALGTFAAAFLVRPIGGAFFGPLGDRIGRQKVLALTMIMMAAGTFAIGLIPSYNAIGVWAPVLLILARMVQGFSTGGEYGGACTFIAEYAPDKKRGFFGSFLEFGTLVGYVAGALLATALTTFMAEPDLYGWGWRIPFLIAGPVGLIGLYVRMKLEETPAFQALADEAEAKQKALPKPKLREMFVGNGRAMILCIGLVLVFNVTDYMLLSYMPTFLSEELGYDATHGTLILIGVMVLMMAVQIPMGRLNDRVGHRVVIGGACVGFVLLSVPALLLIRAGSTWAIALGLVGLGLLLVGFTSSMPSALPALFPTKVRYGSLSVGFNISVSLFGGTTPLIAAALIATTGNLMIPAYYLMGAAVIGGIAAWFMPESAGRPLPGSPPAVETEAEARQLRAAANGPTTIAGEKVLVGTGAR